MSGEITAAPDMIGRNALVLEPDGYREPPPATKLGSVSVGTGEIQPGRRMVFVGVQHRDGRHLVAVLSPVLAFQFADDLMDALKAFHEGERPQ
jgi:hypothetical protein